MLQRSRRFFVQAWLAFFQILDMYVIVLLKRARRARSLFRVAWPRGARCLRRLHKQSLFQDTPRVSIALGAFCFQSFFWYGSGSILVYP